MVMYRVCGHVGVVNSAMLERLNIESESQISGGSIDLETGIITEAALRLIDDQLQAVGLEDIKRYLIQADRLLLQEGLTDVMSDDFIVTPLPYEMIIQAISELKMEKKLHVRITEQVHFRALSDFEDFIAKGYPHRDYGGFRLGPLKLLLDGSLGGRTARLNFDYHDAPGQRGMLVYPDEVLKRYFDLANLAGMDCHIHAIGDGAIDQFLRVMRASIKDTKRTDHRHAIIHAQLATRAQISEMQALGISHDGAI
jgi:predicted amidohydrolase YtcJ